MVPDTGLVVDPPALLAAASSTVPATPAWFAQLVPAIRTPLMHSARIDGLGRTLPVRSILAAFKMDGSATMMIWNPLKPLELETWIGTDTELVPDPTVMVVPPFTLTTPVEACTLVGMSIAPRSISGMSNSTSNLFNFVLSTRFFPKKHSRRVNIRVFGVSEYSYSHETLGIEKDCPSIPEIYGQRVMLNRPIKNKNASFSDSTTFGHRPRNRKKFPGTSSGLLLQSRK